MKSSIYLKWNYVLSYATKTLFMLGHSSRAYFGNITGTKYRHILIYIVDTSIVKQ